MTILIVLALWAAFLLGFIAHGWLFGKITEHTICPLCNERIKQLDKWA